MKYVAGKCLMFRKVPGYQMASKQCMQRKAGQEVLRERAHRVNNFKQCVNGTNFIPENSDYNSPSLPDNLTINWPIRLLFRKPIHENRKSISLTIFTIYSFSKDSMPIM